jgi:quercetin 2,3-dioxygenase
MLKIHAIRKDIKSHWVGDGFYVKSLVSYGKDYNNISPFLLLDYAKYNFPVNSNKQRGVGMHPHRGFETVTIVYKGEVEHKDTCGNTGKISTGDVQWMTAGNGILHEEMHSLEFTKKGGDLHMVQLWVNLPAKNKLTKPKYQELLAPSIPVIDNIRIIAGEYRGVFGAASTFSCVDIFDISLKSEQECTLPMKVGYNNMFLVLEGEVTFAKHNIPSDSCVVFSSNTDVSISATQNSKILFLSGEPITEPIAGYGPFVMNTEAEIHKAIEDLNAGTFLNFTEEA